VGEGGAGTRNYVPFTWDVDSAAPYLSNLAPLCDGCVDWDQDGVLSDVSAKELDLDYWSICGPSPKADRQHAQLHKDHNDWANLLLDFTTTLEFADAVRFNVSEEPEIQLDPPHDAD